MVNMFLVCGLGNFGNQYVNTRHNIGFQVIDIITQQYASCLVSKEKFKGKTANIKIGSIDVILLQPHTYMNLSGQSVQKVVNYYKIPIENIIIIHDDLDLAFSKLKIKVGGGSAGHGGIKSIDQSIGKDYCRIRIGIGRPNHDNIAAYVLSQFNTTELQLLELLYYKIADSIELLLNNKKEDFIQKINL